MTECSPSGRPDRFLAKQARRRGLAIKQTLLALRNMVSEKFRQLKP